MELKTKGISVLALVITMLVVIATMGIAIAAPGQFGANVTEERSERAEQLETVDNDHDARAGNVTELSLDGVSITNAWQGYFGNVSGTIILGDASGNLMYNWSVASPQGEVYAVNTSESVSWSTVNCFDVTNETKVSSLEEYFGVRENAPDGVAETFSLQEHPQFYVGSQEISENECRNVKLFNEEGEGTFNQVLLEDEDGKVIFTSLLDAGTVGFDGGTYDFQMLVLDNGREETLTTYYFYLEIE